MTYDDDYKTCRATWATLRIMGLPPDGVTRDLELQPSEVHDANGWYLTSKQRVESKDARRHIDWILDQLVPRSDALRAVMDRGARVDISCCWVSADGHGGPTVSPPQTEKLAQLAVDLWFDVYLVGDEPADDQRYRR